MKKLTLLLPAILVCLIAFAQDDEDSISMGEAGKMVLIGGGILLLGLLIHQISFLKGLGTGIMVIGGLVAGCSLLVIVFQIIAAIVSVAIKVALIIGVIIAAFFILRAIYNALSGKS